MPSYLPNLLINGSSGIAVGMATNIPPHNLGEVVDGLISLIKNPDIKIEKLMKNIIAPDFPTAGIIYGYAGVKDAFLTGRGRIIVRAKANIETCSAARASSSRRPCKRWRSWSSPVPWPMEALRPALIPICTSLRASPTMTACEALTPRRSKMMGGRHAAGRAFLFSPRGSRRAAHRPRR